MNTAADIIAIQAKKIHMAGMVSNTEMIVESGREEVVSILGLSKIGTQRIYGRNGSQLIAESGTGQLYIITAVTNPRFAKAIKKVLPINNAMPKRGVNIQWSDMAVWAEAVDAYIATRTK